MTKIMKISPSKWRLILEASRICTYINQQLIYLTFEEMFLFDRSSSAKVLLFDDLGQKKSKSARDRNLTSSNFLPNYSLSSGRKPYRRISNALVREKSCWNHRFLMKFNRFWWIFKFSSIFQFLSKFTFIFKQRN